jgi:hypothetical protein
VPQTRTILRIGLLSMAVGAMVSALTVAIFEAPGPAISGIATPTKPATTRAFTAESAAAITLAGALETSSPVRVSSQEMLDLPGASSQAAQPEVRIPDPGIEPRPAETPPEEPVTTSGLQSQEPSKTSKQRKKITQPSQRRRDRELAAPDHNRGNDNRGEITNNAEWGWP